MPAEQLPVKGTFLECDPAGTTTFAAVPLIIKLTPPSSELRTKEVTHLLSTFIEKRATIPDPGKLTFGAWFDIREAAHTVIRALPDTAHNARWRITFPTTPVITATFTGILTTLPFDSVEVENFLMVDGCNIELTSLVTWATAS